GVAAAGGCGGRIVVQAWAGPPDGCGRIRVWPPRAAVRVGSLCRAEPGWPDGCGRIRVWPPRAAVRVGSLCRAEPGCRLRKDPVVAAAGGCEVDPTERPKRCARPDAGTV